MMMKRVSLEGAVVFKGKKEKGKKEKKKGGGGRQQASKQASKQAKPRKNPAKKKDENMKVWKYEKAQGRTE